MAQRIAARLVTGPPAFLLGGLIEMLTWMTGEARTRLNRRRRRR